MKFLGIEIERKTDILAMAAFLISTGSIIGQVALLLRGADVILDGPRQIVLFFGERMGSKNYLNAISTGIYVNRGTPGYDDILKSEKLHLRLNKQEIQLRAQHSVESTREGDKLVFQRKTPWKPARIGAGDFVSHETPYVPYPYRDPSDPNKDFLDFDQLVAALRQTKQVKVTLKAETYGGQALSSECFLLSSSALHGILAHRWVSLACFKLNELSPPKSTIKPRETNGPMGQRQR